MATPRSQRIGIWIIAIVLAVGTLASFVVIALNINNNNANNTDTQTVEKLALNGYSSQTFDTTSVTDLKVEVLKEGTGDLIKATDTVNVSYFGWTADGKIFDSSQQSASADSPAEFSLVGLIPGWTEGLTGQKASSVIRLTIPADKAYGAQAVPGIPANSPLEFIVEIHAIVKGTST
jgi:FKBP-type peptidyl-prolyl cis-trans isomerase